MDSLTPATPSAADTRGKPRASTLAYSRREAVNTVQSLVTALILAFMFRAFLVEAFIIPTGSMAPGLVGEHFTHVCDRCGWEFDVGPDLGDPEATAFVRPALIHCPNCQHTITEAGSTMQPVKAGDRILVAKWPIDFGGALGPRRWDVIVFRDPLNPAQNYIKRLVALPGESVEIVRGDVFINGRIVRKTLAAQAALWTIVADQNCLADEFTAPHPRWAVDPPARPDPRWTGLDQRIIQFHGNADPRPAAIAFPGDDHRAWTEDRLGFNGGSSGATVEDYRVVAELTCTAGDPAVEWSIELDHRAFTVRLSSQAVTLTGTFDDAAPPRTIRRDASPRRGLPPQRPCLCEFSHLDRRVALSIDGVELIATADSDYPSSIEQLRAQRDARAAPVPRLTLSIAGGDVTLRGLRVDRDVHYTARPALTRRAAAGDPFTLAPGEFFVLGDNSAHSHDSREWFSHGPHLWNYRDGTVRFDQIVGRAAFVYLPGVLPLDQQGRWHLPDIGRARFIR
ncbi:MAG: hypothetical protein CHACPFDD_02522 [Phycisphaerae bacterium]|nr:hypothetical protein [Phycisphaerae bacterium]